MSTAISASIPTHAPDGELFRTGAAGVEKDLERRCN
jgi:hypothetical protein